MGADIHLQALKYMDQTSTNAQEKPGQQAQWAKDQRRVVKLLGQLQDVVEDNPHQPRTQLAEEALTRWQGIVEGKGSFTPFVTNHGCAIPMFHQGMNENPEDRIDPSLNLEPIHRFPDLFSERMTQYRETLSAYLERDGYRGSYLQCDQVMAHTARVSRFLSDWMAEAERKAPGTPELSPVPPALRSRERRVLSAERWMPFIRWQAWLWEPLFNDVMMGWEENDLLAFDSAVHAVVAAMDMAPEERQSIFPPEGFPLRPKNGRRQRLLNLTPEIRPQKGRGVFKPKLQQLLKNLEGSSGPFPFGNDLAVEISRFISMAKENHYMVVEPPSFHAKGGHGSLLIRGNQAVHSFALDPMEFWKKSSLFRNGTYSLEGGGLSDIYLSLRQLERHFQFGSSAQDRVRLAALRGCLMAWEENRKSEFTNQLFQLASQMRSASV